MSASKGYITLTYEFHKEGRRWVGLCKELGTSTYHRSLDEVEKQLKELVLLHLDCLEQLGERERFFKENNIQISVLKPKSEVIQMPIPDNVYIRPRIHQLPVVVGVCGN
jgi:hypothetical protein